MSILYLSDEQVRNYLDWNWLVPAMEGALSDVSKQNDTVIQPPRLIMKIPSKKGALLSMPSFSQNENALGCKVVTSFLDNEKFGMPTVLATVLLFDADTGKLKVIMEGTEVTGWRTAAASVVGTKYLHRGRKDVLAILGAGVQARTHAMAFQHVFRFKQVKIWNRHPERARKLCEELGSPFEAVETSEECVKDADVICTATYTSKPLMKDEWLKDGAHINAIGAGMTHFSEVDEATYRKSLVAVDSMKAAEKELRGLVEMGVLLWGEIGEVINKKKTPGKAQYTIFHSLGMAIEDVLAANLIYKTYLQKEGKSTS